MESAGDDRQRTTPDGRTPAVRTEGARSAGEKARDYVGAALVVLATVGFGFLLRPRLPVASLALVFVCGVLVVALRTGRRVAAFAALLAALAYNFFFTEPRYTLRIHDAGDVLVYAVFVAAALLVGQLASRQRQQLVELEAAQSKLAASRLEADTERLRTALLSSVSHDLRSPLAAVIGAASSLSAYGDAMPAEDRGELLQSIRSEGERLDRYIQNLLDMTRLGSGPLKLDRDWVGFDEIVAAAAARLARLPGANPLVVAIERDLPPLRVHAALVEQALFNVLENAVKFSPPGAPVELTARRERTAPGGKGDRLVVDVEDHGPGIPAAERERIFELFHSTSRGSGLGLTIVRGMIQAHGGTVEAGDRNDGGRGARLRFALPIVEPPASPEEEA